MQFNLLLEELESFNLPKDEFAITSSGVLAVRNLRDAGDLDLIVTKELWGGLAKKFGIFRDTNRLKIKLSDNIEVHGDPVKPDIDPISSEELIQQAEVIDGIRYVNLRKVRQFKEQMGRDKDLADVKLIDEYLATAHLDGRR